MSSFQSLFLFMVDQTPINRTEEVRVVTTNPEFSAQKWLLDKYQRPDHLMLDILKPATGAGCKLSSSFSIRVALPYSSHRREVPTRRLWRGICAVFSRCAAAGKSHLDLPLSKKKKEREGGRMLLDHRGLHSYRCPMSHSDLTEKYI